MTFRYLGSQITIDALTKWYGRWLKRSMVLQTHYCRKVSIEYASFLPDHPNENLRWEFFLESSTWWSMFYRSYNMLMMDYCHFNEYMNKIGITLEPFYPIKSGSIIPTLFGRPSYEICYHYLKLPPTINEVRNLLLIHYA